MPDGKFSRRRFLAVTGSGAAALGLAGCYYDNGYGYPIEVGIGIGFPIYYKVGAVQLETDAAGTQYALDPIERTAARLGVGDTEVWKTPHDSMGMPTGIAFGSDGRIYVADLGRHEILVLSPDGSVLDRIGTFGAGPGEFNSPSDVLVDARGWLYVCDTNNHRIQVLDADGNFVAAWGAPGELNGPCAFALDGTGELHVVDAGNRRIVVFDRDGRIVRTYAEAGTSEIVQPRDIAIDRAGVRYVVDGVARVIQAFDALTESALSHVVPTLPDGRPVVPMRASINPAGGLFLLANPL